MNRWLKNREVLYCIVGAVVFLFSAAALYMFTDLSVLMVIITAAVMSLASDILIVLDNDLRNRAPDAKFHQRNELVGESAEVLEDFSVQGDHYHGRIEVRGETWQACSVEAGLQRGEPVMIVDRTGMMFTVSRPSQPDT